MEEDNEDLSGYVRLMWKTTTTGKVMVTKSSHTKTSGKNVRSQKVTIKT